MALSGILTRAGHAPDEIATAARVHLDKADGGFAISTIELATRARVAGLSEEVFRTHADEAKSNCPVSKALTGVKITLEAELAS
jgi:osmotically inducible protein OsmC